MTRHLEVLTRGFLPDAATVQATSLFSTLGFRRQLPHGQHVSREDPDAARQNCGASKVQRTTCWELSGFGSAGADTPAAGAREPAKKM